MPVAKLVAVIIAASLRLLRATWRIDDTDLAKLDRIIAEHPSLLIAFWHEGYIPLFALLEGRTASVLVAQSFRGRIIAQLCRSFGYQPVMSRPLRSAQIWHAPIVALAVDGPLGPRHRIAQRLMRHARTDGRTFVPVASAATPRWIANGRWDKLFIGLPWARVTLHVGDPIDIGTLKDEEAIDIVRFKLEAAYDHVDSSGR